MSREKSIFEQMGGTYTEIDGILYPNIRIGEGQTEDITIWFVQSNGRIKRISETDGWGMMKVK